MASTNNQSWLMKDRTIIILGYLGVCVVVILALTVCVLMGHDGALVKTLAAISVAVFGTNLWHLIGSRKS